MHTSGIGHVYIQQEDLNDSSQYENKNICVLMSLNLQMLNTDNNMSFISVNHFGVYTLILGAFIS